MRWRGTPVALLALTLAVTGIVYLGLPDHERAENREQQQSRLREVIRRAQPLIAAIDRYTAATGRPPESMDEIIPAHLDRLPESGMHECSRFEFRSLRHKQGAILWYDLGSRQGAPMKGASHFNDGDPDHAILVFELDAARQVNGAVIDRLPKDRDPEEFEPRRWQAGGDRIGMALAFAESYRLYGMPQDVVEQLLGTPDGIRVLHTAPWELRVNCPTGLLNHDSFIYWPGGDYPPQLYGGMTEPVDDWVYVRSAPFLR